MIWTMTRIWDDLGFQNAKPLDESLNFPHLCSRGARAISSGEPDFLNFFVRQNGFMTDRWFENIWKQVPIHLYWTTTCFFFNDVEMQLHTMNLDSGGIQMCHASFLLCRYVFFCPAKVLLHDLVYPRHMFVKGRAKQPRTPVDSLEPYVAVGFLKWRLTSMARPNRLIQNAATVGVLAIYWSRELECGQLRLGIKWLKMAKRLEIPPGSAVLKIDVNISWISGGSTGAWLS